MLPMVGTVAVTHSSVHKGSSILSHPTATLTVGAIYIDGRVHKTNQLASKLMWMSALLKRGR